MNKPEVTLLKKGAVFKILQVTGEKDMQCNEHGRRGLYYFWN